VFGIWCLPSNRPARKKHPRPAHHIHSYVLPCRIGEVSNSEISVPSRTECVSFGDLPHTSALFLDYLHRFERVARFFSRPPRPAQWFASEARTLDYPGLRRARVAEILERQNRGWGAAQRTWDNLARFRGGACAAVTGQQVGLFGGPLFAVLKAISAVRLADEATQQGVACVPVFWLATEDHDLAEVNHATFRDGLELKTFTTAAQVTTDAPISSVALGDDITALAREAAALIGGEVADILAETYHSRRCLRPPLCPALRRLWRYPAGSLRPRAARDRAANVS